MRVRNILLCLATVASFLSASEAALAKCLVPPLPKACDQAEKCENSHCAALYYRDADRCEIQCSPWAPSTFAPQTMANRPGSEAFIENIPLGQFLSLQKELQSVAPNLMGQQPTAPQ